LSRNFIFRIKETTANSLEKEAKQKEISLNTLANQIFNMYTDWHSNAGKAGFIIQHDMGKKWSIYLADLYQSMIEELDTKRVNCDLTDNTISFSIDEKYILKQV